jgi:hypothetical protein
MHNKSQLRRLILPDTKYRGNWHVYRTPCIKFPKQMLQRCMICSSACRTLVEPVEILMDMFPDTYLIYLDGSLHICISYYPGKDYYYLWYGDEEEGRH